MEWFFFPTRINSRATAKLISDATTEVASPAPTCSSSLGWNRRGIEVNPMPTAATRINAPSTPLEKYSALPCP